MEELLTGVHNQRLSQQLMTDRGLGFRGFGFRALGFRGFGFRALGFRGFGLRGLRFRGLGFGD